MQPSQPRSQGPDWRRWLAAAAALLAASPTLWLRIAAVAVPAALVVGRVLVTADRGDPVAALGMIAAVCGLPPLAVAACLGCVGLHTNRPGRAADMLAHVLGRWRPAAALGALSWTAVAVALSLVASALPGEAGEPPRPLPPYGDLEAGCAALAAMLLVFGAALPAALALHALLVRTDRLGEALSLGCRAFLRLLAHPAALAILETVLLLPYAFGTVFGTPLAAAAMFPFAVVVLYLAADELLAA